MWLLELTQPSIYLRISLISKTIPTLFTKIRNYDINFWDHSALSMMYSHFFTNKFEAIQNELSNSDLELEPEIQQEEVKLVTFSYPFLGESTLSVQLVGDFNIGTRTMPLICL